MERDLYLAWRRSPRGRAWRKSRLKRAVFLNCSYARARGHELDWSSLVSGDPLAVLAFLLGAVTVLPMVRESMLAFSRVAFYKDAERLLS